MGDRSALNVLGICTDWTNLFITNTFQNLRKVRFRQDIETSKHCKKTSELAIDWLNDYAVFHGDQMPDKGIVLLAYKTRKIDIFNQYFDETVEKMQRTVSRSNFYKIWADNFPGLKIKQVGVKTYFNFKVCAMYVKCYGINYNLVKM